jgi:hypothetical protein
MRVDRDIKRLSQTGILESFRLSFFVQNWQKISQKEKYFHYVLLPFIVVLYCQLNRLILLRCYFKDIIFFTKGRLTDWFSKGFKSLRTPLEITNLHFSLKLSFSLYFQIGSWPSLMICITLFLMYFVCTICMKKQRHFGRVITITHCPVFGGLVKNVLTYLPEIFVPARQAR